MSPRAGSAPSTAPGRTLARRSARLNGVRGVRATGLSAVRASQSGPAEATPRPVRSGICPSPRDAHTDEDVVDLIPVGFAFSAVRQPHEISRVDARDLAERPADMPPEVEDAAGRSTGWWPCAGCPVAWWWRGTDRVVLRPRRGVTDRFECRVDVHHLPSRGLASEIRMMASRQAPMGARDRLVIRVPIDAQDGVGVAAGVRHGHPSTL